MASPGGSTCGVTVSDGVNRTNVMLEPGSGAGRVVSFVDDATFVKIERDIFARIREMKGGENVGGIADASSFDDVEIEVADDDHS